MSALKRRLIAGAVVAIAGLAVVVMWLSSGFASAGNSTDTDSSSQNSTSATPTDSIDPKLFAPVGSIRPGPTQSIFGPSDAAKFSSSAISVAPHLEYLDSARNSDDHSASSPTEPEKSPNAEPR